jgi:hypothetical protein
MHVCLLVELGFYRWNDCVWPAEIPICPNGNIVDELEGQLRTSTRRFHPGDVVGPLLGNLDTRAHFNSLAIPQGNLEWRKYLEA